MNVDFDSIRKIVMLDSIIKGLKEKGYEIVPISKLIYAKNYQMYHEGRQFSVGEEDKMENSKNMN